MKYLDNLVFSGSNVTLNTTMQITQIKYNETRCSCMNERATTAAPLLAEQIKSF